MIEMLLCAWSAFTRLSFAQNLCLTPLFVAQSWSLWGCFSVLLQFYLQSRLDNFLWKCASHASHTKGWAPSEETLPIHAHLMQHQEPKLSPYILLLFHQRQLWHTPLDGRHSRMVWLGFSSVSVLGHWASPSPFQNIIAITHHGNCGVIVGEGLCPMSSFFPQTLCSPTPCISVIVQCGELPVIYHQSFLYVMKIKRTSIAQAERSTKT